MTTPEAAAREIIDRQLKAAGWTVVAAGNAVDRRPSARCELSGDTGRADYILYLDGKACGILEAKRSDHSLEGVQEQSATYAAFRRWEHSDTCWQNPLPFRFEANGRQIQFTDARDPECRARPIFHFPQPEALRKLLAEAKGEGDTLRRRLAALPTAHPLDGFMAGAAQPLRDCQHEAITGLEASLAAARPRSLIHMATGAGKTFTAFTEVYRLLKFARLKRVLFLVDRNSLGTQAKGEFDTYAAPDTGKLFPEVYNVCHLGAAGFDPVNQVVISTIQRLFAQLKGDPEAIDEDEDECSSFTSSDSDLATGEPIEVTYQPNLPPETFDLIIVDECHRSICHKWKQVLDYFDAFTVGLTATPSLDTEAFFHQNTVSRYTYRQSVLDEVNVDYIAYRIATRIGTEGSSLPSGSQLELFDSYRNVGETHAIEDDLEYGANELGRSVIADDQIRTVLETYRDHLYDTFFPGRSGQWVPKTLIFAKTDAHADRVIRICRDVFDKGDTFCRKITHKAATGFLAGGLGILRLVLLGVIESHGAAVDGFDDMAAVGVLGPYPRTEPVVDLSVRRLKELHRQASPAFAAGPRILAWSRQSGVLAPCLNETHALGQRGVRLKYRGEPRPENRDVTILPDPPGHRQSLEELGGKDVCELHRAGGNG